MTEVVFDPHVAWAIACIVLALLLLLLLYCLMLGDREQRR